MHETYDQDAIRLPHHGGHRRLGIVGGGQLAAMTAAAARRLGCDVAILERYAFSPAEHAAGGTVVGDWNDPAVLVPFAANVDVLTIENEFVSTEALAVVEAQGHFLRPTVATLRLVQDKFTQKQALAAAGLSTVAYAAVANRDELREQLAVLGVPAILKTRRNGYDGKGNAAITRWEDIDAAWRAVNGDTNAVYVEAFCEYVQELATIVTRGADGAVAVYPVVETVQQNHVCRTVTAPAAIPPALADVAAKAAVDAIVAIGGIGSFGVEMFRTKQGAILINELAPRVHNSGHYTIEACVCSQFENHVRAVMGWPLGSASMLVPAAVMVNLLGTSRSDGHPHGLTEALAVPGATVHIYGKAMSGAGRKMGHVTAVASTTAEALQTASRAAAAIRFGAHP